MFYLGWCCSITEWWSNGIVGHLYCQVGIVNERPSSQNFTRLKIVAERPQVGIPKQGAMLVVVFAMIRARMGRRRRPRFGGLINRWGILGIHDDVGTIEFIIPLQY